MAIAIPEARLTDDYRRCAEITRKSSSNFYYAFMLLPRVRRRALYAVYAFCRYIDDVADCAAHRNSTDLLARWREELDKVYAGRPTRAISRAMADSASRFKIPRLYFEEIIAGVEMDLTRRRYATFQDLYLYCYRVASAVGLISIEIFGYTNPDAKIYAEKLGIAFQLTNILRDVREDAGRGRIYLPLEDLEQFRVGEIEILRGEHSDRLARLIEAEVRRTVRFYDEAEHALPAEDRRHLLSAEAMRLIYRSLLRQIERSRYRVLDRRHGLSALYKLFLVGRTWMRGRFRPLWT